MKTNWKPYVAPLILTSLAAAIYVWPIGRSEKPSANAERYVGSEHPMRRARTAAAEPVLQIALVDVEHPVATAATPPILVGISGQAAWFKSASSGAIERVGVSSEVEGWTVTSITQKRVILKSGAQTETMDLFKQPAG